MSTASWTAELVGFFAGVLNIISTFPLLWSDLHSPRHGPRDWPQLASRTIQLLANLAWFTYSLYYQMISMITTTGFMSICLILVILHSWWRPAQ